MKRFSFIIIYIVFNLTQINGQNFNYLTVSDGNNYTVEIKFNKNFYEEIIVNSLNEKSISEEFDFENNLELPLKSFFIAIPSSGYNTINILNSEYEKLNENLSEKISDKIIKNNNVLQNLLSDDLLINGTFWYENNLILHLSVPLVKYNNNKNFELISEIKFNIKLNELIPDINESSEFSNSTIILNPLLADKIKSVSNFQISTSDDWINYDKTYVKVGTNSDGIYRISYEDLVGLNINISEINPKTFQLINKGIEIPIYVFGENDNTFDLGDYVEFIGQINLGGKHREVSQFGEPYNEYLDRYSDTSIYWLTWNIADGQRVEVQNNVGLGIVTDTLSYHYDLRRREQNVYFDFSMADLVRREMPFWTENKTWVENQLGVTTRSINFTLDNIFPNKPVYIFSKLQSYATNIVNNAHLLAITLNNQPYQDSGYINKYEQKVLKGIYNSNSLINGTNTIRVRSSATQASPNACAMDWYEIDYPRYNFVTNDSLIMNLSPITLNNYFGVKLTNVNTEQYSIWKYGNGFKKYIINRTGSEIYFEDSLFENSKIAFFAEEKIKKPKIFYSKNFKNLRNPSNSAEYLSITHQQFIEQVTDYNNFISNIYNITTKVIDIYDIYDEFAYGYFNPESIRDFLKATHTFWLNQKPKYVTLIGSATYDYYGNKTRFEGAPRVFNYVPSFGASVSDNWFVTWDTTGAYIPQINIGRIPAKTNSEFEHYFNKHINYVNAPYNEWNKNYIFFSGGTGNDPNQLNQLKAVNDDLINNLIKPRPIGGNEIHFYKTINPTTNFGPYTPGQIQSALDAGAVFISYIGHSGTQTWDNSITQPGQLRNKVNRNPLISDFGCSTARFGEPNITSFSQLFLLAPEGQAIAYIGNSSLGFLSTSVTAPKLFYQTIIQDSITNIGEAHKRAKLKLIQQYGSSNVNRLFTLTNTLIGDPVVILPIPQKPNLTVLSTSINSILTGLTDDQNLLDINLTYFNFGSADLDSFYITVSAQNTDSIYFADTIRTVLPLFSETLIISLPIFNKPGNHTLKIELDPLNEIDEINLNDNSFTWNFYVSTNTIRTNLAYEIENAVQNNIKILNPGQKNISDSILIQISNEKDFLNPIEILIPLGEFYTSLNDFEINNERKWIRNKILNSENFGQIQSFNIKENNKYILLDSISWNTSELNNLQILNNQILLDSVSNIISAFSAGFNDGNTAIITLNNHNYIPENTIRGHHVVLFEDSTFLFRGYKRFDLLGGGSTTTNEYIDFLDTLTDKYILVVAVSNDGRVTSAPLRNLIKTFGSKYIDSLSFVGSWAMIGKKGAPIGSVPEAFSMPFQGPVEVDTTYFQRFSFGSLLTSTVGPAGKWESLNVSDSMRSNSTIQYRPIGIKRDLSVDTLDYVTVSNGTGNLSNISAQTYPYLKFIAEFNESSDSLSPQLSSLGVNYKSSPELGLNYQSVIVSADTIHNGDSINIKFRVWNAGDFDADSVNIKLELIKPDNTNQVLSQLIAENIRAFSFNEFNYEYISNNNDGNGQFAFLVSVDSENRFEELYIDNNIFQTSFYIKPAIVTSITEDYIHLTFDGQEIYNGDYVNNNPFVEIKINVPTWFPVSDTSSIKINLSNVFIPHAAFDTMNYDSVNRILSVTFNPKLSEGSHSISLYPVNANGQMESTPAIERFFNVTENLRIENVYNYPNPFANETHFTFKLTQLPDELTIKIFTISGRLIKEIKKTASELNMDFNRIYWDGKDQDGDNISNGVYFYRIISTKDGNTEIITQKLAKVF